VDEGLPVSSLRLALERRQGNLYFPFVEHVSRCDLEPGEYALAVRTFPDGWVLARQEGIVLRPGANPCDPRLAPLDLRGRLVSMELRLENDDGSPIYGSVNVYLDERRVNFWHTELDGRVRCVVPSDTRLALEPVVFGKAGYERQFAWPRPGEQVLVFRRR